METPNDMQYDVAISFLSQDEGLARSLFEELSKNLTVFVYSERQKELAGTDGLETFRQVFLSRSRVVVVLNRKGYGETKWTRVEERAIKDRAFDTGWEFLLFVTLDREHVPQWVPKTNIRLDYEKYGNELVGAIKLRVQESGGHLKGETALDKARRIQAAEEAEAERQSKMMSEAGTAARDEWPKFCELLREKAAEISRAIYLEFGEGDGLFNLNTDIAGLSLDRSVSYSRDFTIRAHTFIGRIALPTDKGQRFYIDGGPQKLSERTFSLDFNAGHGWCWRSDDARQPVLTTDALSDFLMRLLLEVHEDVKSGKIRRRESSSLRRRLPGDPRTSWMG